MKLKNLLPALMLAVGFSAWADGYNDGIEYYKAGQYDNARTVLTRTLNDANTNKTLALYYLGQTALAQGDKAEALKFFNQGLSINPEDPYNTVGVTAVELLNGQSKNAKDAFSKAYKTAKKDKNYEVGIDIARAYYNADPVAYAKEIDKYVADVRKDSKNNEPAIYIFEGDIKFDNRDLGGAAAEYEQAIVHEKDNPEGYVKYANAYMGVNPIYGVQKLEELVALQPNSALAQRELAEKYYSTNQWVKASEQYGKYIQNPNHFPEDKARYSVLLYASEDYPKSLQMAEEVLRTDPANFQSLRMRLLDLAKLERYNEAAQAAEALINAKGAKNNYTPNDFIVYGQVLEQLDRAPEALEMYKKAVAADPDRADSYKTLSAAYASAKDVQAAAEAFGEFIARSESPSLTDYYQASGRWLNAANRAETDDVRAADAQQGLDAIEQVISRAAEVTPEFYQRQGRLNYAKGLNKSTKDVYDSYAASLEILEADPNNANPNNASNKLNLYQEAYLFMGSYYQALADDTADKDEKKAYTDQKNALYEKADYYGKLAKGEAVE